MKITFVDLRRDPSKLADALERNEEVTISRRGRKIGRVIPAAKEAKAASVKTHPAFGIWADREESIDPADYVRSIRQGRYGGF